MAIWLLKQSDNRYRDLPTPQDSYEKSYNFPLCELRKIELYDNTITIGEKISSIMGGMCTDIKTVTELGIMMASEHTAYILNPINKKEIQLWSSEKLITDTDIVPVNNNNYLVARTRRRNKWRDTLEVSLFEINKTEAKLVEEEIKYNGHMTITYPIKFVSKEEYSIIEPILE